MINMTHRQWHRSPDAKRASAAVYLRPDRGSSLRSPRFAQILANGPEPGP